MSVWIKQTLVLLGKYQEKRKQINKSKCLVPKVMRQTKRGVGGNGQKSIHSRQEADGESSPAGLLFGTIYTFNLWYLNM